MRSERHSSSCAGAAGARMISTAAAAQALLARAVNSTAAAAQALLAPATNAQQRPRACNCARQARCARRTVTTGSCRGAWSLC